MNSQCVEGAKQTSAGRRRPRRPGTSGPDAKYVRVLSLTPIILTFLVYFKGSFRNSIYYIFHIQYVLFEFSAD